LWGRAILLKKPRGSLGKFFWKTSDGWFALCSKEAGTVIQLQHKKDGDKGRFLRVTILLGPARMWKQSADREKTNGGSAWQKA